VDDGHIGMGIAPFGDAALVGDDDEFESSIMPSLEGVEDTGQDVKFCEAGRVVARVVVQDAVTVQQNSAAARAMGGCSGWHGQAMGLPGGTGLAISRRLTWPSATAPSTKQRLW